MLPVSARVYCSPATPAGAGLSLRNSGVGLAGVREASGPQSDCNGRVEPGVEAVVIMRAMDSKLCPKCGAYWACDCVIEKPPPPPRSWPAPEDAPTEPAALLATPTAGCQHDWTQVVGVELDDDVTLGEAQVLLCRLCGLYAVEKTA